MDRLRYSITIGGITPDTVHVNDVAADRDRVAVQVGDLFMFASLDEWVAVATQMQARLGRIANDRLGLHTPKATDPDAERRLSEAL